jgi:hypothetical protein
MALLHGRGEGKERGAYTCNVPGGCLYRQVYGYNIFELHAWVCLTS